MKNEDNIQTKIAYIVRTQWSLSRDRFGSESKWTLFESRGLMALSFFGIIGGVSWLLWLIYNDSKIEYKLLAAFFIVIGIILAWTIYKERMQDYRKIKERIKEDTSSALYILKNNTDRVKRIEAGQKLYDDPKTDLETLYLILENIPQDSSVVDDVNNKIIELTLKKK